MRDTQFLGSAKPLWKKLRFRGGASLHWSDREEDWEIIAQFLYDFGNHLLRQVPGLYTWDAYDRDSLELLASDGIEITDMTELPGVIRADEDKK